MFCLPQERLGRKWCYSTEVKQGQSHETVGEGSMRRIDEKTRGVHVKEDRPSDWLLEASPTHIHTRPPFQGMIIYSAVLRTFF